MTRSTFAARLLERLNVGGVRLLVLALIAAAAMVVPLVATGTSSVVIADDSSARTITLTAPGTGSRAIVDDATALNVAMRLRLSLAAPVTGNGTAAGVVLRDTE